MFNNFFIIPSLQTHPNFQSKVYYIKTAQDIYTKINEALVYQHMFERTTTPWEIHTWNYEQLQQTVIDLEKIDRLYYIYYNKDGDGSEFRLIARMNFSYNNFFYVDLKASCDFSGFECRGGGTISVSKYPEFFEKNIVASNEIKNFILEDIVVNDKFLISVNICIKTHPYFISFQSNITDAIDIYSQITGALYYQDRFRRKTTSKEKNDWHFQKLREITINVEEIDRLYYVYFNRGHSCSESKYHLVARLDYKGKTPLYVELFSSCGNSTIMISKNRNYFTNEIVEKSVKNYILEE